MATGLLNANASSVTLECNGVTAMIAKDTGVVAAGAAGVSGNDLATVGQLGLSKYYESPEQVITSSALVTLPHLLGTPPKMLQGFLVCKVAELGYTVGDVVSVPLAILSSSAADNFGVQLKVDATNILLRFGVNSFILGNWTNGGTQQTLGTSWRLIVRAWA